MAMELSHHRVVYTGEDTALDYVRLLIPKLLYRWGKLRITPAVHSDPVPGVVVSEQHASHYVFIASALLMCRERYHLNEKQTSDIYFSHAKELLGNPLEQVEWSPDVLSTLNLMAFYHIEKKTN
jgi:hypothetical protein